MHAIPRNETLDAALANSGSAPGLLHESLKTHGEICETVYLYWIGMLYV